MQKITKKHEKYSKKPHFSARYSKKIIKYEILEKITTIFRIKQHLTMQKTIKNRYNSNKHLIYRHKPIYPLCGFKFA